MVSCMFYMIKVIYMWYQRRHWNQQNTGWLPQHAQTSDFALFVLFEQRKERRGLGVPRLPGPNANKLMDHWRVDQIGLENKYNKMAQESRLSDIGIVELSI